MAQQSERAMELISEIKPQDPLYNEQITMTSAVEWYYEHTVVLGKTNYAELLNKAKQIEKGQIMEGFKAGNHSEMRGGKVIDAISEQYYNETYSNNTSNTNP